MNRDNCTQILRKLTDPCLTFQLMRKFVGTPSNYKKVCCGEIAKKNCLKGSNGMKKYTKLTLSNSNSKSNVYLVTQNIYIGSTLYQSKISYLAL